MCNALLLLLLPLPCSTVLLQRVPPCTALLLLGLDVVGSPAPCCTVLLSCPVVSRRSPMCAAPSLLLLPPGTVLLPAPCSVVPLRCSTVLLCASLCTALLLLPLPVWRLISAP